MAKRKSTRGVHFSRNRASRNRSRRASTVGAAAQKPPVAPLVQVPDVAIEAARTRLMRARAVLACVGYVLLYEDQLEGESNRPSFADAVDVARDLLDEVIEALDSVSLRAARRAVPLHSDSE